MRRNLRRVGAAAWLAAAVACGGDERSAPEAPRAAIAPGPHDVAVLTVRDHGEIRIELLPEIAPKSVAKFTELASQGYYDGTSFHRVIPGFMIQGGDPNSRNPDPRDDGEGGREHSVEDEFTDFPHLRGVVSLANTGYRNSNGAQFFIVQQDAPHLDARYNAFARVTAGLDIVDAITKVEIDKYGRYGPNNRPYPNDVTIESIGIEPAAADVADSEAAPAEPARDR